MTGAVLLAAPIAMNATPMLSAQTVDAAVKTGWVKESGKWYFYKDGAKATGWQEWDGTRYYLNTDGTMKSNEWMIDADGSIYYFRSWGGAYKSCNVVINGRNYTFGADSKMQGSQWRQLVSDKSRKDCDWLAGMAGKQVLSKQRRNHEKQRVAAG